MKSIYILLFVLITSNFFGQIQVQDAPASGNINAENPFLDASTYDLSFDASSVGKGLVFPRTDLTTWAFNIANLYSGSPYFITAFDGMIVYNSGTGNTPIDDGSGNNPATSTAVTPGFYYFSNPYDLSGGSTVTTGVWTPMGGGSSNSNLTGAIVTTGNTTSLGSFSSSELATAVTDETGTGSVVLAASPSLTGTPTVPTASSGDSSSQIASTAFVANAVKNRLSIKTSDYTLNSQDYTVLCNATNATISLTLPSPSESEDKIIIIKKIDTSYNKIIFSPSVYLTTESETAISSVNYPKTIKIQSNGTNWYVIN
jgi:hypothetical protein